MDNGNNPKATKKKKEGTFFSRSYFQDYEMRPVLGRDGITRQEYIYTGLLYKLDAPKGGQIKNKILHTLMLLVTTGCLILNGFISSQVSLSKAANFPIFLLTLAVVLRFFSIIFFWAAPLEMTSRDFKWCVKFLKIFSAGSMLLSGAAILIGIIVMIVTSDYSWQAATNIAIHIPEGMASLISFMIEKKAVYTVRKSVS